MSEYLEQLQEDEAQVNFDLYNSLLRRRQGKGRRAIAPDDIRGKLLHLTLLMTESGYDFKTVATPVWFDLTLSFHLKMMSVAVLAVSALLLTIPSIIHANSPTAA